MSRIFFVTLIFFANSLFADCADFSRYTSWAVQDEEKIVFYRGPVPIAIITLQGCRAAPNSGIRLTKAYLCDGDKIVVDGEECNIISIDLLQ